MTDFIRDQERFSDLISHIGNINIKESHSINDLLTIKGVNLWLVSSPEMAWRHLVNITEGQSFSAKLKTVVKPFYHQLKLKFKPIKIEVSSSVNRYYETLPRVIALGFSPKMYSDVVEPVSLKFEQDNSYALIKLSDCNSFPKTNNMPFDGPNNYVDLIRRKNQKKRFIKKLKTTKELIINSENFKDFLISNSFGVNEFCIRNLMNLFFGSLAPASLTYLLHIEEILDHLKPVCIISPDTSDPRCRVVSLLSKRKNIPTYEIQFGLTGPEGIEWKFFVSSRVAVWGNQAKAILISHGVPESKIEITGSPRHDDLVASLAGQRMTVKGPRKIKILLASTYTDPAHERYCPSEIIFNMKKSVIDAVKNLGDVELFIKPHPMEDPRDIKSLLPEDDDMFFLIDGSEDIRGYIKDCDAFLSFGSSATLDALIAGKRVGSLCFDGWNFSDEIIDNLPVTKLNNAHEVQAFIKMINIQGDEKVLSNELEDIHNLALTDGRSSTRVYEDIRKLINNWS